MKCIIPATNARVFAKAIQSLAKIGTDLFVEADDDGLSIRTVSSTKAAFAMIRFDPNFFTAYNIDCSTEDEFANKCKVSMKSCVGIFKNMKHVELCKIEIDSPNSKLIVELKCRLETIKTHSISILDFETLQAVYMTDNVPNILTASHKLFSEISNNFQMNEEEITLEAGANHVMVKNYVEGSHVDRKFMRSQLKLQADEFGKYKIGEETSITFCLREFRAFLGFAESINMDLTVNFETGGRPVVFVLNNLHTFEGNLVMSTLSPDDITYCEQSMQNQSMQNQASSEISSEARPESRKRNSQTSEPTLISEGTAFKRARPNFSQASSTNDELFNFPRRQESESIDLVRGNTQANIETQISLPVAENRESVQSDDANKESEGICVTFKDTEDLPQADVIPKSPTTIARMRKIRKVFKRCFEATFNPNDATGASQILAVSSDTED